MDWDEVVKKALDYFNDNNDEFEDVIEELDNWNGWPEENGTMYYPMDMLDDHFYGMSATEIIDAVDLSEFSTSDNYYYENGSGWIVSTDYKDYSDLLDDDFIDEIYDCRDDIDLPEYIEKLFEAYYNDEEEEEDEEEEDFEEDEESEDEDFGKE